MEFRILGPLEIDDGEGRPISVGGGRPRALLADLLLHANEVVSTDHLIDDLWGETPPETAAKALQGYVSHLRKVLEPNRGGPGSEGVLLTRPRGYLLRLDAGRLDARRFQDLATEGHGVLAAGRPAEAAATLREALSLWRGPALSDFAYQAFAQGEITRLEELRVAALEDRVEADLALGRHAELVGELESLVAQHPLRERLRGQLMLALYRSTRQAEALDVYREARRTLVEELGLEPSEELQRLQRAILAHDPAIEPPAGTQGAREPAPSEAAAMRPGRADVPVSADSIAVIDPETNHVLGHVPVGSRPVAVVVGHGSVWVANADDGTVSRIDPKTARVLKTIGIGAPAIGLAVGPRAVWVANGSEGTLSRIDPGLDAVAVTIDLRGSSALAPNAVYGVATGAGSVWAAAGGRSLFRIDPDADEPWAEIDVRGVPVGVAAGEDAVWVATLAERAFRIEPRTNAITGEVSIGVPVVLAVGGDAVWVADSHDSVWRVDLNTSAVIRTIPVGKSPVGIAVASEAVWVANNADGTVSRIDPDTNRVVETIRIGFAPTDVAIGEGGVWVSLGSESANWVASGYP